MALVTYQPQPQPQYHFAADDEELEQQLQDAVEASNDDFAFRLQLNEIVQLSNFTFAYQVQLADIQGDSSAANLQLTPFDPSFASSSSSSHREDRFNLEDDYEQPPVHSEKEAGKRVVRYRGVSWLSQECVHTTPRSLPVELCGICFDNEDSSKMFEGIRCLHRFCYRCITRYIHLRIEEKRHQIFCPQSSCREPLSPEECRHFLPEEIFEAWSAALVEAEIPESQRVYCPFPDCSALLVKEEVAGIPAEDIRSAECPFCNRLFCVQCHVPWHANLHCVEYQELLPGERSHEDLLLFKLAEDSKWQRCEKCKRMIELEYGCNHMTCRCGHEFCYVCGVGWVSGRPKCSCPRTTMDRIVAG
eukprot:Gb_29625 [translate_table: standard]